MCLSGNLWIFLKDVEPLVLYDVEHRMATEPMQGYALHLELFWGTEIYFAFLK